MLGIVDHFTPLGDEVTRRVLNHREVLLERGPKNLRHVQRPRFSDDGHHRHAALEQRAQLGVLVGLGTRATRGAKRRQTGVLQLEIFRLLKKRDVARIGAGKTAFNVIHPERVEFLGNEQLVGDGKANAFALGAITQGGIVYFDGGGHKDRKIWGVVCRWQGSFSVEPVERAAQPVAWADHRKPATPSRPPDHA